MCEQALLYRDNRSAFDQYSGQYILLQRGEVRWHDTSGDLRESRRVLAGQWPGYSLWLKYVDPQEAGRRTLFDRMNRTLQRRMNV